jgi:hypothetical protein
MISKSRENHLVTIFGFCIQLTATINMQITREVLKDVILSRQTEVGRKNKILNCHFEI